MAAGYLNVRPLPRRAIRALVVLGLAVAVLGAAGLAAYERAKYTGKAAPPRAEQGARDEDPRRVRAALVEGLAAQHHLALAVAATGQQRAEHAALKELAFRTTRRRTAALERLRRLGQAPYDSVVVPYRYPNEVLGIPESQLGRPEPVSALVRDSTDLAGPFDRAFIDVMVANSLGAIRIARAALSTDPDRPVERAARDTIAAERCEIALLNEWRTRWHGLPFAPGRSSPTELGRPRCDPDGQPVAGPGADPGS